MKTHNTFFKQIAILGLLLMMALAMTACGAGSIKWDEEIQLSDGKIIVIERQAIYVSGGAEWASNPSGSKINEDRIQFEYPVGTGQKVEWRTIKKDLKTYPEIPLVFDVYSGLPTIYSLMPISLACEVYSKYVYKNGAWVEELLPEQFEQHTSNLLFASMKNLPALLKLAEKNKRNDDIGHRRALYQTGPNRKVCGE